jgi:2-polyprenyl-3-methyl-5-hydroxy-6-metoxy-1,4-benzoquinol methylase
MVQSGQMKANIAKVAVVCNSCGSSESRFITHGVEHEYDNTTSDVFNVVQCTNCELIYLNPRPDVSELKTIYPDNYYAYGLQEQNVEAENQSSILYRARKYVYLSRLTRALDLCRPSPTLKVLDVGCADGRALNWYKSVEKYKVETYGVDFDRIAVEKARASGHTVFLGRFEDAEIENDTFDLVVATHVIEHVADPKGFARRAFEVLKPGGVFLCETPNAGSFDARVFSKQHWGGYHFPRHWVFYNPKSIAAMATSVGFIVESINYHPAPAFWNWTCHSIVKSWAKDKPAQESTRIKGLADALFPPVDFQQNNLKNLFFVSGFTAIDVVIKALTGTTSNMAVVLRRPSETTSGV